MCIAERWLAVIEQLGVLAFCTYADAVAIACVCKAARDAVAAHPWALDQEISQINRRLVESVARGATYEYVERWHRICPRATHCTIRLSAMLQGDAAFFADLKSLCLIVDIGRPGRTTFNLDETLAHARHLESLTIEFAPFSKPFGSPLGSPFGPPFGSPFGSQLIASNMAFSAQRRLRRLSIQGQIYGAQNRRLQRLFAPLEALEELELVDSSLTVVTSALPHPHKLRRLRLERCQTQLADSDVWRLTSLVQLSVNSCPNIHLTRHALTHSPALTIVSLA